MDKIAQQLIDQLEALNETRYLYREGSYFGRHVVVTAMIIDPEETREKRPEPALLRCG